MKPTHIILHQASGQVDGAVLYRASDGMVLGARSGTMVNFGEDPKQTSQRHFIDKAHAIAYLRKLADDDPRPCTCDFGTDTNRGNFHRLNCAKVNPAIIEDRDADKRIITPAEAVGSALRN